MRFVTITLSGLGFILLAEFAGGQAGDGDPATWPGAMAGPLEIRETADPATEARVLAGRAPLYENRTTREGRVIHLDFVVLPATGDDPAPDPVFVLQGGPGVAAAPGWRAFADSWIRDRRDIVLVNQRGTGGDNRLDCDLAPGDEAAQSHFEPIFRDEAFRGCLEDLERRFDLTQYSTCNAVDDFDDLRQALGYETINLYGGSYGTRAALVYMRQHPESIRTAILNGVAPIGFTNPLYHASEAQSALDRLFAACAGDPACATAFPNLEREFEAILKRLAKAPVEVETTLPGHEGPVTIELDRDAFAEALRVYMYYSTWDVPLLIHGAYEGDFEPFVQLSYATTSSIRTAIAFGMLLCVTCAEDIDRIDRDSIERETRDTFLGDGRVRRQMAVCEFWPRSPLPEDFGDPVSVDVPTLVLTGFFDPVTGPRWGEEASRHLPQSRHVIMPQAHGVGGACVDAIVETFLESGTVEDLDSSCAETERRPAFTLPAK